jgi:hypothetical protein
MKEGVISRLCGSCGQPTDRHPYQGLVDGGDGHRYRIRCTPPLQVLHGACEACRWVSEAKVIPEQRPHCGGATSPSC